MLYIEDCIDRLACNGSYIFEVYIPVASPDVSFITSMSTQTQNKQGFTEKQRKLALVLVHKYRAKLAEELKIDIDALVAAPVFKNPVRILTYVKSITIEPIETGKIIAVRFPYNEEIVQSIRAYKQCSPRFISMNINWNPTKSIWEFGLMESNILHLASLLDNGFVGDDEFLALVKEAREIENNIELYVPMVVYEDNKYSYKNSHKTIPQPTSNNILEVLLEARSYGITCWDEAIDIAISTEELLGKVVPALLKNTTCNPVIVDATLNDISDIIRYSDNVLFVIPGGTELDHLTKVHAFLQRMCYTNEQVAVMFRLDSSSGKMCNEFIKNNKMNNSLSDKTKFVFVSGKIPKPLIEANKKFDIVVHFGTNSAHYTLKNYIKAHHNVISMNIMQNEPELKFV